MILSEVKNYLQARGLASLTDIALHVNADPDAVRGMLERWIRKGKVRKQMATASCGSACSACATESIEFYEWTDSATTTAHPPVRVPARGCPES